MDKDTKATSLPKLTGSHILSELRAVTWPTRKQTWQLTLTVLIICLIVGAYVGIIDAFLAKILEIMTKVKS